MSHPIVSLRAARAPVGQAHIAYMFKLALGCEAATLLNIEMLANELPIGSLLHRRNARIETRKLREVKISAAPAEARTP